MEIHKGGIFDRLKVNDILSTDFFPQTLELCRLQCFLFLFYLIMKFRHSSRLGVLYLNFYLHYPEALLGVSIDQFKKLLRIIESISTVSYCRLLETVSLKLNDESKTYAL
jgi:hypothetical protein